MWKLYFTIYLKIFSYSQFSWCVIYPKFRRKEENRDTNTTLYISDKRWRRRLSLKASLSFSGNSRRDSEATGKGLSYSPVTSVSRTHQHVSSLPDPFSFAHQMHALALKLDFFICLFKWGRKILSHLLLKELTNDY